MGVPTVKKIMSRPSLCLFQMIGDVKTIFLKPGEKKEWKRFLFISEKERESWQITIGQSLTRAISETRH